MAKAGRWAVAVFLVVTAFGIVFILDPTSCDGDVGRANAAVVPIQVG
jgi:hypothetical protein